MLRCVLAGASRTIPAKLHETKGTATATLYPAYVSAPAATGDYGSLDGKPSINGVTLDGELSLADLGIDSAQPSDIDALFEN